MKSRRCLLCPNKAAPGSSVCTACHYQQYPQVTARICKPTRRKRARVEKLRAEREGKTRAG